MHGDAYNCSYLKMELEKCASVLTIDNKIAIVLFKNLQSCTNTETCELLGIEPYKFSGMILIICHQTHSQRKLKCTYHLN